MQNVIDINLHTFQEDERIRQIKKFHFFDKLNLWHKYDLRIDSNLVNKRKKRKDKLILTDKKTYETYSPNVLNKTHINSEFRKYFKRICNKPLIPDIMNSRTRKYVIPFSSKITLKKHNIKNIQVYYKQASQKIIDKRSTVTEPNFYKNNQHIFYSLLNESNQQRIKKKLYNNLLLENKELNSNSQNKKNMTLSQTPDSKIKNNFIRNSFQKNRNNFTFEVIQNKKKKEGIIDFLFLDNWEEKTQFERKFFYKNKHQ